MHRKASEAKGADLVERGSSTLCHPQRRLRLCFFEGFGICFQGFSLKDIKVSGVLVRFGECLRSGLYRYIYIIYILGYKAVCGLSAFPYASSYSFASYPYRTLHSMSHPDVSQKDPKTGAP